MKLFVDLRIVRYASTPISNLVNETSSKCNITVLNCDTDRPK